MKINNITKGLGILLLAGGMASCSSDYLDLDPLTQIPSEDAVTDESSIRLAVNGLSQSMYRQYNALYDYGWFNGEPWIGTVYGDVMGQDYSSGFWQYFHSSLSTWISMNDYTSYISAIAWQYCYGLINQANLIIDGVPEDMIEYEIAFRLAQAYTIRAHAYVRLHQIYGPRWADSDNGNALSVPLRLSSPTMDEIQDNKYSIPRSTTNEVLDQIYADLDKAIELYEASNWYRDFVWEPDIEVAQGIYARAALLKDDWETAYEMSTAAAEYYPVMSADDYVAGFVEPNDEWIWCSGGAAAGIYYASFGGTYGCNGPYPSLWGIIGAGAVDYEFYKEIYNENDVRCSLFLTPDKFRPVLQTQFWSSNSCSEADMNINMGNLADEVAEFVLEKYNEIGASKGWPVPFNGNYYYGIYYYDPTDIVIPFGEQFKFWAEDEYGTSSYPFMRSSEMLLTAAEAAYHLQNETEAKQLLDMVNAKRISDYSGSTATGSDLLDEIKLYRRWELWGEGFNWFDFKRWNEPIIRQPWVEKDLTSGNWPLDFSGVFNPEDYNGWQYSIPQIETQYNEDISVAGGN